MYRLNHVTLSALVVSWSLHVKNEDMNIHRDLDEMLQAIKSIIV